MLNMVLKTTVVCFLIVSILLGDVALGTSLNKEMSHHKREKRTVGNVNTTRTLCNDQFQNMIPDSSVDSSLLRYTPSTPSPEDVNCFVEVPVTRRVGGRCVLLGSRTWGCQAGIFLAFSSECQSANAMAPGATQAQAGGSSSTRGGTHGMNRRRNPFRRTRTPNNQ